MNDLEAELKALEKDIENPPAGASTGELQYQYRQLEREYERQTQHFEEDFNVRRNEELFALQQLVSEVILQMAKGQGFDLIVQDPVVWASDQINITDHVLEILQEMHDNREQQ